MKNRELVALKIGKWIVNHGGIEDREKALDQAIRTGLAIITEGVLVAPLEGVADVKIKQNDDGSDCVFLFFAGPIRAAGGTGQALSVLIADYVRRDLNIGPYQPQRGEIERYKEEIPVYKRVQHLQYAPGPDEIELIAQYCPICITGEGTEDEEVAGYRDLQRVETNRVRGGACLVMAEGMCLKASKIQKHVRRLNIEGWEFIDRFIEQQSTASSENEKEKEEDEGQSEGENEGEGESEGERSQRSEGDEGTVAGKNDAALDATTAKNAGYRANPSWQLYQRARRTRPAIPPIKKFMKDCIAGRPVLAFPSRIGGFRLRYGRGRTCGLAAIAIHPAAFPILEDFIAVGTQVKIERPGKAGGVTPCDTIEGPIVLLMNGSLVQLETYEKACEYRAAVQKIVDIGEMLVPFGEFAENNKLLPQGSFSPEWWMLEYDAALSRQRGSDPTFSPPFDPHHKTPDARAAFELAEQLGIPLHPRYNLFWHDLSLEAVQRLAAAIEQEADYEPDAGVLRVPNRPALKELLVTLGALHREADGMLVIERYAAPIVRCLGLDASLARVRTSHAADIMDHISELAGIWVIERAPTRIGARMGRPEKAAERKMKPPVHALFPIGEYGGSQRLVRTASDGATTGAIDVEVGKRLCPQCQQTSWENRCPQCHSHTEEMKEGGDAYERTAMQKIDLTELLDRIRTDLDEEIIPPIKAVKGMISKRKIPEPLAKGFLRTKHDVFVFKDGTARFDMSDLPITHFRPSEIGTSVEKLRELGYEHDIEGEPLKEDDQLLELRCQDFIGARAFGDYMLRVAQYVDDLLVRFYNLAPFYRATRAHDLVGHLFVGLAPHTSGGVLNRLIGYTDALVGYGHPFFHAAKRRNCDGDEDCQMLLLDGLLNFSRTYLPEKRGGLMDAPLVMTTFIDPNEIDKEAQNVDLLPAYPLEFYHHTLHHADPKEVEPIMDTVGSRIGTPAQYEGFRFTHDTGTIHGSGKLSSYKTLGKMTDKMDSQLLLARRLRPVDASVVATKVISSHLIPDMIGNLRSFSKQTVRCCQCGTKYRRIPLAGICTKKFKDGRVCRTDLTLTVHEGSVKKYLSVAKDVIAVFDVDPYVRQRVELLDEAMESLFCSDHVKNCKLSDFF